MIGTSAAPNLWDMSMNGKQGAVQQYEALRPHYSLGDGYNQDPRAQTGAQGLAAQQAALRMYGQMAAGDQSMSLGQQDLRRRGQQNANGAYATAAMGRGGNLMGQRQAAGSAAAGTMAATGQQSAIMQQQEQQAAQAAYADLAARMAAQGYGYDKMNLALEQQGDQNALGWYQSGRELDQKSRAADRQFYGQLINGGIGMASSLFGALGGM